MIREAVTTIRATIEIILTDEAIAAAEGDPVQAVQDEVGHTGAVVTTAEVI